MPQALRLALALAYIGLLLLLSLYLNGQLLPPFGLAGLWFYSAFAALVLGDFLIEPFFTRPADALANGVALVIAAASISLVGRDIPEATANTGRLGFVLAGLTLVALASVAIGMKDREGKAGWIAQQAYRIATRVGRARVVFSALLFAAGFAAFSDSGEKLAALYLTWVAIFVVGPLEILALAWQDRKDAPRPVPRGKVERIEDPQVVVARLPRGSQPRIGSSVSVADVDEPGRIVDATTLVEEPRVRIALAEGSRPSVGAAVDLADSDEEGVLVGRVAAGTALDRLVIDVSPKAAEVGLEEGRLVEVPIAGAPVLYQVTEAELASAREEDFRRDYLRVAARKLGTWHQEKTSFDPAPWVPLPGEPVNLLDIREEPAFATSDVGRVPGTPYGVQLDLDRAVTHNTAILGILGVGKTRLAWELVQRMLVAEIKVVVLDITGQYSIHLADVCDPAEEAAIADAINGRIAEHLDDRDERHGQAGNVLEFRDAMRELLQKFMAGPQRLMILNPNRLEVSRMEGKPFSGKANLLLRLTMVEITQIIAETILELVDDSFTDEARVCLVLEEAHSLVPEWNSTVHDAEQSAVNGTARAILQGRKYGFGCLLITQRTANVTKSILNQCNTIFGLRIYDATGMGFLENYIGPAHSRFLATLQDRQAVVFGRASSCSAPIILGLNDSQAFHDGFWEPQRGGVPRTKAPESDDPAPAGSSDGVDVPF